MPAALSRGSAGPTALVSCAAAFAALAACRQGGGSADSFATYAPAPEGALLDARTSGPAAVPVRSVAPRAAPSSAAAAAGFGALAAVLGAANLFASGGSRAARRPRARSTALRALTEIGQVKLNLPAGKATPAPPVGPALGQFGANIAFFVKEYNAMTADKAGNIIPVIVHVMSDRSFTLELKTPPTAALIHKAVGKDRGSGKAGTEIIGSIDVDKLREIAELKLSDLNCADVTRAMKIIHGTCVASGVEVEGYEAWLASVFPRPESILDRYGPGKANLPAPYNEE